MQTIDFKHHDKHIDEQLIMIKWFTLHTQWSRLEIVQSDSVPDHILTNLDPVFDDDDDNDDNDNNDDNDLDNDMMVLKLYRAILFLTTFHSDTNS